MPVLLPFAATVVSNVAFGDLAMAVCSFLHLNLGISLDGHRGPNSSLSASAADAFVTRRPSLAARHKCVDDAQCAALERRATGSRDRCRERARARRLELEQVAFRQCARLG